MTTTPPDRWERVDGSTVACTESIKVLSENWTELETHLQESFDDAVLLGVSKADFKAKMHALVEGLTCDFKELTAPPNQED